MKLELPHRVCKSTCFSNGVEDIFEWKGSRTIDYLVPILGGMGEFTYLKFKNFVPEHMVYWGANTKYFMRDLGKIIGFHEVVIQNKTFKSTLMNAKDFIDHGQPVVAGALDMYYLGYYPEIFHKSHIPIHYVLVTGYDDEKKEVYIHDCAKAKLQAISYSDFENALNVNVPGMSKKNTLRVFDLPGKLPNELEMAQIGLHFRAEKMLTPPVKLFGIPAMRKFAKEIFDWQDQPSFEHLVRYATTPPEMPKTYEKSNGMRFWKSRVLEELGKKYKVDKWMSTSAMFRESGKLITEICKAAMQQDRETISNLIIRVADIEEKAYTILL